MAYDVFELSVESGRPVELYKFTVDAVEHRYTSSEDTVTYAAQTFTPLQIDRSSPAQASSENSRVLMEISLPADNVIGSRYIGIVPPEPVEVEVIRFHRTDSPNGEIIWNGRIVNAKYEKQGAVCRLFVVSSESALSRPMPAFKYQSLCNFVLFDAECKAVKADFKYTGTATVVAGRTITVAGLDAAKGADWSEGGTIEIGNDHRLVLDQTGDVLTIDLEFATSPLNQSVDVFAGCDHSLTICESKFANELNYGGFAYVPHKNPFNTGL